MRERVSSAVRTGLVGLAVAGAVGYSLYRLAAGRRRDAASEAKEQGARPGPGGAGLQRAAGLAGVSSAEQTLRPGTDLSGASSGLEMHHLEALIHLLESTEDILVQEQILVTLSNSAAFSINQDIIRCFGGLSVVGKMLSVPVPRVKQKALNALNNLSMNVKNQEETMIYIPKACEEVDVSLLNSELQLAGLQFLTNMSVTDNYHFLMTSYIPNFLHLLFKGNERTQVQVLKVLVNLSGNPSMTEDLLKSRAPFLLSLLESGRSKDILLRVLTFATNLTKFVKKDKKKYYSYQHYSEDSIFSVILGNSPLYAQKLASLLSHPDVEVNEKVAALLLISEVDFDHSV